MIDSEAYSHREKMMKLREELLSVEESRMSGTARVKCCSQKGLL